MKLVWKILLFKFFLRFYPNINKKTNNMNLPKQNLLEIPLKNLSLIETLKRAKITKKNHTKLENKFQFK